MSVGKKILLLGIIAALAAAAVFVALGRGRSGARVNSLKNASAEEKTYQGRPESEWVRLTSDADYATRAKAYEAALYLHNRDALSKGLSEDSTAVVYQCAEGYYLFDPQKVIDSVGAALAKDASYKTVPPTQHLRFVAIMAGKKASPWIPSLEKIKSQTWTDEQKADFQAIIDSINEGAD